MDCDIRLGRVDGRDVVLPGILDVPDPCVGLVIFAHGSGSSRLSPRNQAVATDLRQRGLGTLLFDLLTDAEAEDRQNVFDIELLAGRLAEVTVWVADRGEAAGLRIGYFGASTGAAAALVAAAQSAPEVAAVVSRGGRPDLAGRWLDEVAAPTLLIVGGRDEAVLDLNEQAKAHLRGPSRLEVVPGATHLFEESGALEAVADLAGAWFLEYLPA